MLASDGGNPEIIFRYRTSFRAKHVFDLAIMPCRICIATEDCDNCGKIFNPANIFRGPGLFFSAIKQFADCNTGNENLLHSCELGFDPILIREQINDYVCIQEISTTHENQSSRSPSRLHRASTEHLRWLAYRQIAAVDTQTNHEAQRPPMTSQIPKPVPTPTDS